ncbi:cysteine desulfurase [Flavonifractor sp. DFI.6.63]|uniref:cysteine desulfurase family protein n=1 Tax=Oscillospiraceae TaxID=216572 RepID=UPI002109C7DE|nr:MULTISPECIES: cysteine desulfurase family protein [Oscillospiraceae]MBS1385254.1 cysteine desulfurase [Flavonifractor sp.]MDU2196562.1 cysteine desulfurase family protein [Clostridiales bacterium]MDY2977926.1 cysteine desulfurase family protein [Oscillospiraceae bacterium]MCI6398179.1 cysteine desulfurase [Lawsonibacter sp.]MCQ5028469.1 cysteine desulfurase [Flavonifractor sp. DFI.6.63]
MPAYLDNAATTRVCPEAARAALEVMTEGFGNPSSGHAAGRAAAARLAEDRAVVAQRLGCAAEELYFTSCGTEGDNWSIRAAMEFNKRRGRHIVVSAIEHSAVLEPVRALAAQGCEVTYLKPDKSGRIRCEDLQAALRPDTALVSLMLVNNELGTLQPVRQAAEAIRRSGCPALLHTDAVQAFLKVPFTPAELGADLLTVSGHKIRAPKGIGVQYVRRGLEPSPLLLGGGQEQGRRPGTEPTAQIAALAAACRAWDDSFPAHLSALKQYALETLAAVPGLEVVSAGDAPHICAVSLPGYPSEMLVRDLSDQGVSVSSGSACHKGKPSHVFAALGLPKRTLMGVLRISFSPENTRADVDALRDGLIQITKTRIAMR